MVDSPETVVSGAPVTTEANTTPVDSSATSEPDVDVAELRAAMSTATEEAQLKATVLELRRATGHIPGIQSSLTKLEAAVADVSSTKTAVNQLAQRFDALISALPEQLLPERTVAALRPQPGDSSQVVLDKLAALEDRITNPTAPADTTQDMTPEQMAAIAQWDVATASVAEYARRHEIDVASIEDAVWTRAAASNMNDPAAAAVDVMKHVDTLVKQKAHDAERADAGKGGNGARTTRTGPLTVEQLKSMTAEEIMKIPAAERMAALTAS